MRRTRFILAVLLSGLLLPAGAQAVLLHVGSGTYGVALMPGATAPGVQRVTAPAPCADPWLAADLGGPTVPSTGLCYRGGAVLHGDETFDLAWDPLRRDWASTRNYVEQYLRNVADGSGTLTSPYAVATQYRDSGGRAANASVYGGGCIDFGSTGGASCQFGNATGSSAGNAYPASGCPVVGINQFSNGANGPIYPGGNDVCLTDAQISSEVASQVAQEGIVGRTRSGLTPLVVVMTPPGVVDCLDAAGSLCSSNRTVVAPTPTATSAASGGSLPAGSYKVVITYALGGGESVASAPQTVTVGSTTSASGSSGTSGTSGGSGSATSSTPTGLITVASPPPVAGATGWYAYVTQADGSSYYKLPASGSFPLSQTATVGAPPSGNPTTPPVAQQVFCSYHSSVSVGGTVVPYVVQPWTALTGCDEPGLPAIPTNPDPETLAVAVGARLVSPISQATIAALTDPFMNGWASLGGGEVNDNGCQPLAGNLDSITLGSVSYYLQRVFNNGGVLESDPNALACEGTVGLAPRFVVPSSVDPGDVVEFDGSKTVSTLLVPRAGYAWNFGDGSTATGPSVVHSYAKGGTYNVTLTTTDRGGNTATLTQPITVYGAGPAVPPPATLNASLRLVPQSLRSVLHSGLLVRITSNRAADGFTTLAIPRSLARRLHLRSSSAASVVVGRGTLSGVHPGTMTLHVRLPAGISRKLARLHHLTLSLRLTLIGAGHLHATVDAAGSY